MTKRTEKEPYKSMLVAGIDVGAATAKTVILNEGEIRRDTGITCNR